MVNSLAMTEVELCNLRHFLLRQREIPDRDIRRDAADAHGLGQDRHAALRVPAECHLRQRLAVFITDLRQHVMRKDAVLSLSERFPSLWIDIVVFHRLDRSHLLKNGGAPPNSPSVYASKRYNELAHVQHYKVNAQSWYASRQCCYGVHQWLD